jgi:hypothetical protein
MVYGPFGVAIMMAGFSLMVAQFNAVNNAVIKNSLKEIKEQLDRIDGKQSLKL